MLRIDRLPTVLFIDIFIVIQLLLFRSELLMLGCNAERNGAGWQDTLQITAEEV